MTQPRSSAIWLDAIRPKTLPLALASIITGSAIAAWQQTFSWTVSILTLVTAMLLQILSNLANDYGDAIQGTDNAQRLGPIRGIQQGHISLKAMRNALIVTVLLTCLSGLTLIFHACAHLSDIMSFIGLGALAIFAAITYTVGNKPYGYMGLGDISVLIFFGWLGVAGTYYLHVGTLSSQILLPATACGLLAVAVLNINNLRDIDNDRACGKNTLAVRFGPRWGRIYHLVLLSTAMLCFIAFALLSHAHWTGYLFLAALPLIVHHGLAVWRAPNGQALRPMMGTIVKCALLTNALFALGLIIKI
ncbi:1,4-dihydroxy-2-naphthoate octaprenyltransferase [Vibrio stylophorae]|uniref:1,4-dihydroxy-2-naphthoate octaprenyltransferase n=1 Tax=Vibrio stylophorae TaxID=659351 RepID=A0ABM8ZW68_9VIBR|nr:1,4-dihydroxy-2-naphthoate polyprenyltransferase [Vibrio stylophorae]CAH0534569.1 1,4-dihydroxy-2-naphthoate octaprenyltransferase [Vibrio stylophorae]